MSLYDEFVELQVQKKSIEADLAEIKDKISDKEAEIIAKWGEEGLNSVKMPDGRSLWLDHKFWASAGGDQERLVEALRFSNMSDMIKESVNRNSLSALVREYAGPLDSPEDLIEKLPSGLRDAVKITETTNVRVRGL